MSPPSSAPPARFIAVGPSDLGEHLAAALAGEPGVVLVRPSPATPAILAQLPAGVPLAAVVPDLPQLAREVGEQGAVRAALARLRRGGVGNSLALAVTVLRHLRDVARQDFRGIVPVMMALDRAGLGVGGLQSVVLAAPLTDLLLAAGHGECLAHVAMFVRRRMRAQSGLETLNLGHLLPRLANWGVTPDFVIGPLNPRGFRMKPSPGAVVAAVRRSSTPVIASEITAGGTVPLAEGLEHARSLGAAGVVVTLDDLAASR